MKAMSIILGIAMSILGVCAATMPFRVFLGLDLCERKTV